MSLIVTAELITQLHESPANRAIVLTADGWSIECHPNGWTANDPLVAVTREGIEAYLNGFDFDQDVAHALAVPDNHPSYAIADEDGGLRPPAPGVAAQVVTDTGDDGLWETTGWSEAWWFDQNRATRLIAEPEGMLKLGARRELWRTEAGRYVQRIESIIGESSVVWPVAWSELTAEQAVARVYRAKPEELAVDLEQLPSALHAARLAAQIVELLQAPQLAPESDPEVREALARREIDHAAEVFADTALVSNLLRTQVTSALRDQRGRAGRIVWAGFSHTASRAAKHLGVSRQTLQSLAGLEPDTDSRES